MKDDLISRRAVVAKIREFADKISEEAMNRYDLFSEVSLLREVADHIESMQPAQQWTPVEERLPEEDGNYYVTVAFVGYENEVSLYTEITSFSAKEREFDDNGIDNYGWDYVTAWMPLQWNEPYDPTAKQRFQSVGCVGRSG